MDQNLIISQIMSLLLKRIIVPQDYQSQCLVLKEMLTDDVSGIVDSLTDFLVESSSVDFSIETKNETYKRLFQEWFDSVNLSYGGKIPIGMNELAKEYYKERWKGSSFPVLKIAKWGKIEGSNFILPHFAILRTGKEDPFHLS